MTLEQTGGGRLVDLIECPACGADLRQRSTADHLLLDHQPEDFGLDPIRRPALDRRHDDTVQHTDQMAGD
jgi:hypothetical protein